MKNLLLLAISILLYFTPSFAQNSNWKTLLSSSDIKKVYTYKNNTTYVLFKTSGFAVLNHNTGEVTTYNQDNSPLPTNTLKDIVITEDSIIYLATGNKGLIKITNDVYEKVALDATAWISDNLNALALDANGNVWATTFGFKTYQLTSADITTYNEGGFNKFDFTANGDLWGISNSEINRYNGTEWETFKPVQWASYNDMLFDDNGIIWVASSKGLLKFENETWTQLNPPSGSTTFSDHLHQDANGNLIFQISNKWVSYNTTSKTWADINSPFNTAPSTNLILNNNNDALFTVEDGYILESSSSILDFPYTHNINFRGQPKAMLEDSQGNLWVGTNSYGLYRIKDGDIKYYNYNGGFTDSQIYDLEEDQDGKIWIAGPNRLHYYFNDSIYEVKHSESPYLAVNDIFVDDDNSLWLGTSTKGLYHITTTDTIIYTLANSSIPEENIQQITRDKKGNLLVGFNQTFATLDNEGNWFHYTPQNANLTYNYINLFEKDAFGNVWIAMDHSGNNSLAVWDGETYQSFDVDPENQEFAQASIYGFSIDKLGNKWLATSNFGLARFDGNSTTYYDLSNSNVPDLNLYTAFVKKNGEIIVGAYDVLSVYKDPREYLDTANIKAEVYVDENENGVKDLNEEYLPFARVKIWGSNKEIYADAEGKFSVSLSDGSYLITNVETDKWEITGNVIPFNASSTLTNLEIPFIKKTIINQAEISLTGGFPRCNRDVVYHIEIRNDGTEIQDATVTLATNANVFNLSPSPESFIDTTYTWSFSNLTPGEIVQLRSVITMPGFDGDFKAIAKVDFYNQSGVLTETQHDTLFPEIRCSYDPNDKTTLPAGIGEEKYLLIKDSIEYVIRFQNTGNDTAFNVMITDTLSSLLNYASFKYLSSSHPVEVTLSDSIASFYFRDILLPDSTTNEKESNGFVRFRIYPKNNIDENTILNNAANIFFDFNPPIITNTTNNTMVTQYPKVITSIEETAIHKEFIEAYPNPTSGIVHIQSEALKTVTNSLGESVYQTTNNTLDLSTLNAGIYIIQVGEERIKIVKQ